MPPRFKTGLVLACILVFLYILFAKNDRPLGSGEHAVDQFGDSQVNGHKDGYGTHGEVWTPTNDEFGVPVEELRPLPTYVPHTPTAVPTPSATAVPELEDVPDVEDAPETPPAEDAPETPPIEDALETPAAADEQNIPEDQDAPDVQDVPEATDVPTVSEETVVPNNSTSLQEQFMTEYKALGSTQDALSSIYGNTLNTLVDNKQHAGFAFKMLTPTEEPVSYSEKEPYAYNPYPDYNSKNWKSLNRGEYKACRGPQGDIVDLLVFSGHPKIFDRKGPHLGSNIVLGIDDNLCFERETRLGPYGFSSAGLGEDTNDPGVEKRGDWDLVDWGKLQKKCFEANAPRYNKTQPIPLGGTSGIPGIPVPVDRTTNSTDEPLMEVGGQTTPRKRENEITDEEEARKKGLHGMPKIVAQVQQRTAVLIRTHSAQVFTENDKQNIRSLITELSLGSGGEYEIFLLVQVKDAALSFRKNAEHKKIALKHIPREFRHITVLWNDAEMKELYQFIPEKANNVHQSQWLSVQAFAQIAGYSKFDFYWNWEFDSRYTGHHYNLFEKLSAFAKKQPRKGLWERNERFFVEGLHARWPSFKVIVEKISGLNTIWGPVPIENLEPVGPETPDYLPERDNYEWGVGEDADYISLAPMFNPVNTTWVGRNDVWGYAGTSTPRRATIGTQSRCSKKLLDAMHYENMRGNHVSSEMTPSTVALLHGLKAVFAPIPVFFDRAWKAKDLDRFFNPGPRGVSGSTRESPFSWGKEGRFKGSTWYFRADPPQRLYNNWLGWEDGGIGGSEWEETNGRTCLPPMLMHPIKNVVQPESGRSSVSELPY